MSGASGGAGNGQVQRAQPPAFGGVGGACTPSNPPAPSADESAESFARLWRCSAVSERSFADCGDTNAAVGLLALPNSEHVLAGSAVNVALARISTALDL